MSYSSFLSISVNDFEASKAGYRQYLEAVGVTNYDGVNTPVWCISYTQFLNRPESLESMYSRLDNLTKLYDKALKEGQDDRDPKTPACHLRCNIRKLVHEIDELDPVL